MRDSKTSGDQGAFVAAGVVVAGFVVAEGAVVVVGFVVAEGAVVAVGFFVAAGATVCVVVDGDFVELVVSFWLVQPAAKEKIVIATSAVATIFLFILLRSFKLY